MAAPNLDGAIARAYELKGQGAPEGEVAVSMPTGAALELCVLLSMQVLAVNVWQGGHRTTW